MSDVKPIRIASIWGYSDLNWVWLKDSMPRDFRVSGRPLEWVGFSTAPERMFSSKLGIAIASKFNSLSRGRAALAVIAAAKKQPFDVVISHGPLQAIWTEFILRYYNIKTKHFVFAFNFTDLPTGLRKMLMTKAFRTIDEFAVFTKAESASYSKYFNIDQDRLIFTPWGVAPPLREEPQKAFEGKYFAALGGEARDYGTLCEVAKMLPDTRFVAIARPHNFTGLEVPENLTVHFNLPFEEAWAIVWHADVAILPLRSRETPCGVLAIVSGMHLGKAQIVTDSVGVAEYVEHRKTGFLVPVKDPGAIVDAIETLHNDDELRIRLGKAAAEFATKYCSEESTVKFFQDRLKFWFG